LQIITNTTTDIKYEVLHAIPETKSITESALKIAYGADEIYHYNGHMYICRAFINADFTDKVKLLVDKK